MTATAPSFTSATSTTFAENTAGTFAVTATGDTPISFSEVGTLPSGVTLGADGTLAGTPAFGTAGSYPITITATDANSNTSTQSFTLTVTASRAGVHLGVLHDVRREHGRHLLGHGERATPRSAYTETGTLPSGVSLGADGTLAGTPASGTAGSYPITITATDANTNTSTQSFTLTVTATGPSITSASRRPSPRTRPAPSPVTATGDTPISFSEVGALPSGVSLGTDGTLAGTPAFGTAGSYPITITATDANSNTSTQSFTLTVTATGPVFTSARVDLVRREHGGHLRRHGDGRHPDHLHRDRGPALGRHPGHRRHPVRHAGLRDRGQLPDHHHGHRRQLEHRDPVLHPDGGRFGAGLHLGARRRRSPRTRPGTFAVTATGDTPISFTETGALPSGVSLGADGTLAGTPAFGTAGSYPITITATDANSNTVDPGLHLDGDGDRARSFTSARSTTFAENTAGTFAVTATGDTPISFTETGTLPSGVTLASNGTLAGTPAFGTAGSYPITITATDANSNTSTQAFTLTVTAIGARCSPRRHRRRSPRTRPGPSRSRRRVTPRSASPRPGPCPRA